MTDLEINIAISTLLGIEVIDNPFKCQPLKEQKFCYTRRAKTFWQTSYPNGINLHGPLLEEYCLSLDAIHEAEKELVCPTVPGLSDGYYLKYEEELQKLVNPHGLKGATNTHASARHRAEAILRIYDKWEE